AQRRRRLGHLAVHREVDEVLALGPLERTRHEAELHGRLLHALGEVALVEGEPELAVLEHVVGPGLIISASYRVHDVQTAAPAPRGRGVGILTSIPSRAKRVQRSLHPESRSPPLARRPLRQWSLRAAGGDGGCPRPRGARPRWTAPRSA